MKINWYWIGGGVAALGAGYLLLSRPASAEQAPPQDQTYFLPAQAGLPFGGASLYAGTGAGGIAAAAAAIPIDQTQPLASSSDTNTAVSGPLVPGGLAVPGTDFASMLSNAITANTAAQLSMTDKMVAAQKASDETWAGIASQATGANLVADLVRGKLGSKIASGGGALGVRYDPATGSFTAGLVGKDAARDILAPGSSGAKVSQAAGQQKIAETSAASANKVAKIKAGKQPKAKLKAVKMPGGRTIPGIQY